MWCKKVHYFLGLFQGSQSARVVILHSASAAQLAVPKETLLPGFINRLYFPAVAGVLETLEFFVNFLTSL